MSRVTPPVYAEKGQATNVELMKQLHEAVYILEESMKANVPVRWNNMTERYGVRKSQRTIASEAVIAIVREIKKLKGW